jgi:hypothetical protein
MNEPNASALRDLQDPPLPPGLWTRLEDRRRLRFARRRMAGVAAMAIAAVGLFAVLRAPDAEHDRAPQVAGSGDAPTPAAAALQVRAIDRELQAAYQAGAAADEIERLWRARRALLAAADAGRAIEPLRI